MSFFRIICLKNRNIATNLQKQKHITNELLILEMITLMLFIGFYYTGVTISGTDVVSAFCKGIVLIVVFCLLAVKNGGKYTSQGKFHFNGSNKGQFRTF